MNFHNHDDRNTRARAKKKRNIFMKDSFTISAFASHCARSRENEQLESE